MSQLSDIQSVQLRLEDTFNKRMAELEAQLTTSAAKDTVAKVAEEFRTFRELMFNMLSLLRQQIRDCAHSVDSIETRHRRKALLFLGVEETDEQDNVAVINNILHKKMALSPSINACYRIGARGEEHHRPLLVWFSNVADRNAVWNAKSKLRGSSVALREFLTKPRQAIFAKARQHFGMRACWTQDGTIVIKVADGDRQKVITMAALDTLLARHPKGAGQTSSSPRSGGVSAGAGLSSKRKN